MVKKMKKKQSKSNDTLRHKKSKISFKPFLIGMALCFVALGIGIGGYWYVNHSLPFLKHQKAVPTKEESVSTDALMLKMQQMLESEKLRQATLPPLPETNVSKPAPLMENAIIPSKIEENSSVETTPNNEASVQKAPELSEVHEYQQSLKESKSLHKPHTVVRKEYPQGTTPKLAIIIDDVSFPWQTRLMKEIPYKVTPAFFPPTKGHPETVRLSHEFPFAMVHLPLEAKYYSRPEEDTLNTTDSLDVIEKRIKRIKAWFPHIHYYNNHTGGYFTADYAAMDRLIKVMKDHNLSFVDSRTVGNSKAPEVTKKYGMFLYSRDVFLDNSLEKNAIRKQLKEAVVKAKKYGYAIAIGHPHKNTLEVLRDSEVLLEGVEMVYLKEL